MKKSIIKLSGSVKLARFLFLALILTLYSCKPEVVVDRQIDKGKLIHDSTNESINEKSGVNISIHDHDNTVIVPYNEIHIKSNDLKEKNESLSLLGFDLLCDIDIIGSEKSQLVDNSYMVTDNHILFSVQYEIKHEKQKDGAFSLIESITDWEVYLDGHGKDVTTNDHFIDHLANKAEAHREKRDLKIFQNTRRSQELKNDSLYFTLNNKDYFTLYHPYTKFHSKWLTPGTVVVKPKNHPIPLFSCKGNDRDSYSKDKTDYGYSFGYLWYETTYKIDWEKYFTSVAFAKWIAHNHNDGPSVLDYKLED